MRRHRLLLLLAGLLSSVLCLAAALLWWGGVWLRPLIEHEVQQYLAPRVVLASPLKWRLWPVPAVTLHDFTVLGENDAELLTVREAAFAPDIRALLSGRFALNAIELSGITLAVEQRQNGIWNVMTWLRENDEQQSGGAVLPIGRIQIRDMVVHVAQPLNAVLQIPSLEAGPVMVGAPGRFAAQMVFSFPFASADEDVEPDHQNIELNVKAAFQWQPETISLDNIDVAVSSKSIGIADGRMTVEAVDVSLDTGLTTIEKSAFNVSAAMPDHSEIREAALRVEFMRLAGQGKNWRLVMPALQASGRYQSQVLMAQLSAPDLIVDDSGWKVADVDLEAAMDGEMRLNAVAAVQGRMTEDSHEITAAFEQGSFVMPHPAGVRQALTVEMAGDLHFDITGSTGSGQLRGKVEQSNFEGQWRVDVHEAVPVEIALSFDQFDADRYLSEADDTAEIAAETDQSPNLTVWRQWSVDIAVHVGKLHWRDLTGYDVHVDLNHAGGLSRQNLAGSED